jgi:hypothetical protein
MAFLTSWNFSKPCFKSVILVHLFDLLNDILEDSIGWKVIKLS